MQEYQVGQKYPCLKCESSDAMTAYEDHLYCFSCCTYMALDGTECSSDGTIEGHYSALDKRGIPEKTCKIMGYRVGKYNGRPCHIADYRNSEGIVVAQKIRFPDKSFTVLGDSKALSRTLYGMHRWASKGKTIVITEGEIDALSVCFVRGNTWPVVSIPNGAQGAKRTLKANLEYLEGYEEIILMFDDDEPGQKAAIECASLFSHNKAKIATIAGFKDANEAVVAGDYNAVVQAIFNAKTYKPDGIVSMVDVDILDILRLETPGFSTQYEGINESILGLHKRALTLFTAGSGVGKSTLVAELAHHLAFKHNLKIGYVALEESWRKSMQKMIGISVNKPLHLMLNSMIKEGQTLDDLREIIGKQMESAGLSDEVLLEAKTRIENNFFFHDHFGSLESDNLLSKLRYLATGLDVDFIVLDHISIVVSGQDNGGGERQAIDKLMTDLRSLCEETGVGMLLISHLKKTSGKPHEEGGAISLTDLRGSGALYQLSDAVIGLERNQQGDASDVALIRILKNRLAGKTGEFGNVRYDHPTGRLLSHEVDDSDLFDTDGSKDF